MLYYQHLYAILTNNYFSLFCLQVMLDINNCLWLMDLETYLTSITGFEFTWSKFDNGIYVLSVIRYQFVDCVLRFEHETTSHTSSWHLFLLCFFCVAIHKTTTICYKRCTITTYSHSIRSKPDVRPFHTYVS